MAHVLSPRIRCRSSLVLFPSYVCDKHKHDPVQKTTQHSWKQCHHIPYLQHLDGLVDDGNCEAQKLETLLQPRLRLSLAFCSGQCPRDSDEATRNGIRTRKIKNKDVNYLDTPVTPHLPGRDRPHSHLCYRYQVIRVKNINTA